MTRFYLTVVLVLVVGCAPSTTSAPLGATRPGRLLATRPLGRPEVFAGDATFSPDGKLLFIGYYFNPTGREVPRDFAPLQLWDVDAGKQVRTYPEVEFPLTFLPDNKHVLSRRDQEPLRVWDARTGEMTRLFDVTSNGVRHAAISSNGALVLTGGPRGVELWDVKTGKRIRTLETVEDLEGPAVRFSPEGKWAFAAFSDPVRRVAVWRVSDGLLVQKFEKEESFKYPLAFSPDGELAVSDRGSGNRQEKAVLVLWEVATGTEVRTFEKRQGGAKTEDYIVVCAGIALAAAFTADGKYVVSMDDDGVLRRWSVASGRAVAAVDTGSPRPGVVAISADARFVFLAAGEDCQGLPEMKLQLWDTAKGELRQTLRRRQQR